MKILDHSEDTSPWVDYHRMPIKIYYFSKNPTEVAATRRASRIYFLICSEFTESKEENTHRMTCDKIKGRVGRAEGDRINSVEGR